jgi:prophage antirepressor-like protein
MENLICGDANTKCNFHVFESEFFKKNLRVIKSSENIWFIASDISKILEYKITLHL